MTIDEAIESLGYGVEQLEMEIESGLCIKGSESDLRCKEGIAINKQHIEWLTELKEAKRLLKSAVDDFEAIGEVHAAPTPMISPKYGDYMRTIDIHTRKWRYADTALKLIGEDENET